MATDTPTPPRRRARRKEARPGEIVEAALRLFADRGFAATKLEDVAAAAGIGKGTIYLYFPTKEDLFRAVVRQAVLPNLEAAAALLEDPGRPAADILRAIAERFLLLLDTDLTAIPKLVVAESGNFPAIARFYAEEVVLKGMALIRGVLARGVERGEFRPVDLDSALPLFSAPLLLLLLWKHSLGRHTEIQFNARTVVATHLDVLLRGLAADPRP
ncbi:MAG TPA: helix-turn-helix domain-containing protein [Acetobacteraceae bacterium]|nr:helix-turn-helix domain-containing protein [Acetobacteraceae bacterium]